jgi:hypothetical protein
MRALGVLLLILVTGCGAAGGGVFLGSLLIVNVADGEPRPLLFSDKGMGPAPDMKAERSINEQDCTKPIELSGNLRCR